jgi:choline dehydrogenase
MSANNSILEFDYVIVGGGTAGCVMANRLSANGTYKVLLLEAGPADRYPWIHIPIGYAKTMFNPRYNWGFYTDPEPQLNNRQLYWPRGKVLGGSSSINGLIYIRGQAEDYDAWEALGNPGWGWSSALQAFKKLERNERGESEYHGASGPIGCSDIHDRPEIMDAIIRGGVEAGIPPTNDFNGASQEGIGYYQLLTWKGRRSSTAVSYLKPARSRSNLTIITEAMASRITFDGRRATGVEFERHGVRQFARAHREVILSAGAIQSPQLLELSGIGNPAILKEQGVEVRHALPGVGENLQDHLQIRLMFRCKKPITTNDDLASWSKKLGIGLRYILSRRGPMAIGINHVGAFARALPESKTPDVQFHVAALTADRVADKPHPWPGFTLSVCQLRPESRGAIHIKSSSSRDAPTIKANYLSTDVDWRCALAGVRLAQSISNTSAMHDYTHSSYRPAGNATTDDDLKEFIREYSATIFHPVGTCKMGNDPTSVVDSKLKIHGLDGIRVADASIMPLLVSGNTSAPSAMIGEKASEFILEGSNVH